MIDISSYKSFIREIDRILQLTHGIFPMFITGVDLDNHMKGDSFLNYHNAIVVTVGTPIEDKIRQFFGYYGETPFRTEAENFMIYGNDIDSNLHKTKYRLRNEYGIIEMSTLPIVFIFNKNTSDSKKIVSEVGWGWFYHESKFYGKPEYLNENGIRI